MLIWNISIKKKKIVTGTNSKVKYMEVAINGENVEELVHFRLKGKTDGPNPSMQSPQKNPLRL